MRVNAKSRKAGFSLVELTIVVVILGVLALLAVPRYQTAVERSKASEAFAWLAQIETAQQSYHARNGRFSKAMGDLDLEIEDPEFFKVGVFTGTNETRWQLKLTRKGPSSGFGRYTVIWNERGFSSVKSSIPKTLIPVD